MKKILLLLIMLMSVGTHCLAQNLIEVVYLKNGSIIKGTIIEQVPNESLKIKTRDGSLIICQMDEVSKITKEESNVRTYRQNQLYRNPLKGYKGFIDFGYLGDVSDNNASKIQLSTSHGYQFNNHFFLGAGLALDYYTDGELASIPVFVDFRANFINKKVTPFAEVKTGYSMGDIQGVYFSTGIGVRFSLKGKKAVNVSLQYDYLQYNDCYDYYYGSYYDTYDLGGFGFKVGFEF